jgi:hypothetical protein
MINARPPSKPAAARIKNHTPEGHLDAVRELLEDAASRQLKATDILDPALEELQHAKQILASTMDDEGTE